jgi:hypothetical protein
MHFGAFLAILHTIDGIYSPLPQTPPILSIEGKMLIKMKKSKSKMM